MHTSTKQSRRVKDKEMMMQDYKQLDIKVGDVVTFKCFGESRSGKVRRVFGGGRFFKVEGDTIAYTFLNLI